MRATVPLCAYQRKTHIGKSGADNEKIELSYHRFCVLNAAKIV